MAEWSKAPNSSCGLRNPTSDKTKYLRRPVAHSSLNFIFEFFDLPFTLVYHCCRLGYVGDSLKVTVALPSMHFGSLHHA